MANGSKDEELKEESEDLLIVACIITLFLQEKVKSHHQTGALTVCPGRRSILPCPSGAVINESRGHLSAAQDR